MAMAMAMGLVGPQVCVLPDEKTRECIDKCFTRLGIGETERERDRQRKRERGREAPRGMGYVATKATWP